MHFKGRIDEVRVYNRALTATEISALANGPASSVLAVNRLVADHLGTPRMIIDQTGTLANVKRHDCLPFGEDLYAGTGGRSTALGYSGGDGVRQQFTQKERDIETGLDYFEARYYSSTQGRFSSPDPLSGRPGSPQSWNRYAYSINNPLKYIDPSGLWWYTRDGGDGHPQWFDDDPGEGYTRFTQYAYYGGAANGYVALDPFSKNFLTGFGSLEDATAFSDAMAGQTMLERDPPQDISQLDGTLEVAGYIGGTAAAVRVGGLVVRGVAALSARRAAAGAAEEVVGLFGKVSVDALEAAASSSGPTVQIVTKLTHLPQAGRALSVATGEGAEALANAARSTGQLHRANVPRVLLEQLERSGLAIRSTTQMAGMQLQPSTAFCRKPHVSSLPFSKSRGLNMRWCCTAFEGWYGQAGERGIGILIGRDSTGTPEFTLQYRAIEQGEEKLITSPKPISTVAEVGLQYCPWCGRDLERWYGPYVDKLFRPYLKINDW